MDSVFVTVAELPDTSVVQNGNQLQAVLSGAAYQWVDCNNNYAPLDGFTFALFDPATSGSYALIVTQNNCSDTSSCYPVLITDIKEVSLNHIVSIYPNPSPDGRINIVCQSQVDAAIDVFDVTGKLVLSNYLPAHGKTSIRIKGKGMFFVRALFSDGSINVQKVLIY